MVRAPARRKVMIYSYRALRGGERLGAQCHRGEITSVNMCGRYASSANANVLRIEFDVDDVFDGLPGPDYNVAPTVAVPAVFERRVRESGEVRRRLAPLVWGLVPSWAKDASIGSRLINARLETVADKPAFRKAFSLRRCLLPADGFYEWYTPEGARSAGAGSSKIKKQPFFIHRADRELLVMAGIYEIWRDPTKNREDNSAWLRTCSVITRDAMAAWLDPELTDPAAALDLLAVTEAELLEAYPVSTAVNSVQNNDPSLLEPIPEAAQDSSADAQDTLI